MAERADYFKQYLRNFFIERLIYHRCELFRRDDPRVPHLLELINHSNTEAWDTKLNSLLVLNKLLIDHLWIAR